MLVWQINSEFLKQNPCARAKKKTEVTHGIRTQSQQSP